MQSYQARVTVVREGPLNRTLSVLDCIWASDTQYFLVTSDVRGPGEGAHTNWGFLT